MTDSLQLFLIEDDDDIALLIRRCLERHGHRVTRCRSGADALIVLTNQTFDLVLLDQVLPDMSGLYLLERLREEGVVVPVLMVTAHGDELLAARVLRAGALDYIVKDQGLAFLGDLPKRIVESVTRHRLEQMNALLIQALESARDGIMILDLQGAILNVNRALLLMTGYPREELLGSRPEIFWSDRHPPEQLSDLWRTILGRSSWQGELTIQRRDGTSFEASLTISPIVDFQGRLTHFVGIQRDVTEYKRLQGQLLQAQKMQSIGTLAGGVAHEFNNLMAGINGYASLALREQALPPLGREYLEHIVALSQRATLLTRQLLAFARKPALSRQLTAFPQLLEATVDLVRRTLHQDVSLEMPPAGQLGEPLVVDADANQLQQALINLAVNARDAIREREALAPARCADEAEGPVEDPLAAGSPSITFRLRRALLTSEQIGFPQKVPPGDYVLLEVEDQGCGMKPEVLLQAVDPFFTTKEVGHGTGLGLPMVYGIVQGHQGYMTLESKPKNGTRVSLYLPRRAEASYLPGYSPVGTAELVEPETTPGCDILVVDDEDAVRNVVRRFLEIAGHRVTTVSCCREGLDVLNAGAPLQLIILDLMIPREDVATNVQRLRQRRPDTPILLCTGLSDKEVPQELFLRGVTGLLRKPFRMNELWHAVNEAIARGRDSL